MFNVPSIFDCQPSHPRVHELWNASLERSDAESVDELLSFIESTLGERALVTAMSNIESASNRLKDSLLRGFSEMDRLEICLRTEAAQFYLVHHCMQEGLQDEFEQFWTEVNLRRAAIDN